MIERKDQLKINARNRERLILASGGRRLNLWLERVASAALEDIMQRHGMKATAAIEFALIETARRRKHVSDPPQSADAVLFDARAPAVDVIHSCLPCLQTLPER